MVIVLLASIACVFALWIVAEFYWSRASRLGMGTAAILICVVLAFFVGGFLEHTHSNLWFGGVTYELVDATVEELERGRHEAVLNTLRRLRDNYRVSYENRGKYDVLSRDAITEMRAVYGQWPRAFKEATWDIQRKQAAAGFGSCVPGVAQAA